MSECFDYLSGGGVGLLDDGGCFRGMSVRWDQRGSSLCMICEGEGRNVVAMKGRESKLERWVMELVTELRKAFISIRWGASELRVVVKGNRPIPIPRDEGAWRRRRAYEGRKEEEERPTSGIVKLSTIKANPVIHNISQKAHLHPFATTANPATIGPKVGPAAHARSYNPIE